MLRSLDKWLPAYMSRRRYRRPENRLQVFLTICDHFEPLHDSDKQGALARIAEWQERYPTLQNQAATEELSIPRHTFFYPIEQYDPDILVALTTLSQSCASEVEIHLHHKDDTSESLRGQLLEGIANFRNHGLLASDPDGRPAYGFIHGNWALDNSHPEGHGCGVSNELSILRETGCYADFTMPSAPHPTQTRTLNSIYYAKDGPEPKSHDRGVPAQVGKTDLRCLDDHLLLIQGPLALNWRSRKFGCLPRIENADLTGKNPPNGQRLRLWLQEGIHVVKKPEWVFIKLHTHGGIPQNYNSLLGEPMMDFLRDLGHWTRSDGNATAQWVTARQMVNLVHAAEDGLPGIPEEHLDHIYCL